ncbi:MAG: hypothetical protein SH817_00925 [Leptospira sp.]|nr:hypothetical protein [Leptospira sp.]
MKINNLFINFVVAFMIGNCCFPSKYPVKGTFHFHDIETTVDSEIAKYYLEVYLSGHRTNQKFDELIDSINLKYQNSIPNRDRLNLISKLTSVDFAAIYFADTVLKERENDDLQREFLSHLATVKLETIQFPKKNYVILLVPGFDYVENSHITGADFAKPIALLRKSGFNVRFVAIDPIGSVEENAHFIANFIKNEPSDKILIAGASSAGPAIHLSLGNYLTNKETNRVRAWLNLGGILQGVPVLDQFSKGFKGKFFDFIIWLKSWRKESFDSMRMEVSQKRFESNILAKHILVINYIGMSLSGNISKFASDKYCLMRDDGPNDGLSLLPDLLAPDSMTIFAPKSDHFFAEDPEIDQKTVALLKIILVKLEKGK